MVPITFRHRTKKMITPIDYLLLPVTNTDINTSNRIPMNAKTPQIINVSSIF